MARVLFSKIDKGEKFTLKGSDSLYVKVNATYYRGQTLVNAVNINNGDFSYCQSNDWVSTVSVGTIQVLK